MSNRENIRRSEGEWWILKPTFHDDNDIALDITNATAIRWDVMRKQNGPVYLTASLANGKIVIVDGPAGRADITLSLDDHAEIDPGAYYHECFVTLDGGEVTKQFHGSLTVEEAAAVS